MLIGQNASAPQFIKSPHRKKHVPRQIGSTVLYRDTGLSGFHHLSANIFSLQRCFLRRFRYVAVHIRSLLLPCDNKVCRFSRLKRYMHCYRLPVRFFDTGSSQPGKQSLVTARIAGLLQSNHLSAVMSLIISGLDLTADIQTAEPVHIFFLYLVVLSAGRKIQINIFAVQRCDTGSIFGTFHASFYLKRVDARFHQLRKER